MEAESDYHLDSFSPVGAIGLMQLMPDTANGIGVNPYDPLQNVIGGTIYLKYQLDNFSGWGEYSVTCAVAAYNTGPQAVREYGGVPPYRETQILQAGNALTAQNVMATLLMSRQIARGVQAEAAYYQSKNMEKAERLANDKKVRQKAAEAIGASTGE